MAKRISGTREWATSFVNCVKGCKNGCKYCYAYTNAVIKFKRLTDKEWHSPVVNEAAVRKGRKKEEGVVMFPTTHDIFPEVLPACLDVLKKLLVAGNQVLIVSKPNFECIQTLCKELDNYKDQILFRFTIGSDNSDILKYWEPNAPCFEERIAALQCAYKAGFKTSISVEPMLDSQNILTLFSNLEPYVTDTIWIGMMNKVEQRVKVENEQDKKMVANILAGQTPERVHEIYNALKDNPHIMWKESFKAVLGLPEEQEKWAEKDNE